MSDAADEANDLVDEVMERATASRVVYEGESATECVDCLDEIPVERQMAVSGCQRCVDCTSLLE